LDVMPFSVQTPPGTTLNEQLLITRLIISAVLAVLLLVGVGLLAHADQNESAQASILFPASAPATIQTETADAESGAALHESPPASGALGGALCVFGVLCGLTMLIAARKLLTSRTEVLTVEVPTLPRTLFFAVNSLRRSGFTLTQLGLSRT